MAKYYHDKYGGEHEVYESPSHAEVMRRSQKFNQANGNHKESARIKEYISVHKSKERHKSKVNALKSKMK